MPKTRIVAILVVILAALSAAAAVQAAEAITAVPFTQVRVADAFWRPRIETNRRTTVRYCFERCEQTGRISNFAKAAGLMEGGFEGIYFNDSDLYKVIEGAAYSLKSSPDPRLEEYVDGVIDKIATAQWEDGYLYTFYSLPKRQPEKRWTECYKMHELYCAGHFFEAAVAYYQATGKRKVLDVAIRLADYIDSVFGPGRQYDVPGHQEIEIGLVKLYHVTGQDQYLKLAKFFIDQRGRDEHRKLYGIYCQDHKPVIDQTEAVGHAVRAGYLYTGMADVAALTGEQAYVKALDALWHDIVDGKQYVTGGIGARHSGEAFGDKYELPNESAYCETCAAIANALWNHRMFLMTGDGKYIDVLEKVLYNGFLSGVGLSGDRFFYPNPLASSGQHERSPWFDCACCPVNVVRIVPSIPGYAYAQRGRDIYVNLFIGGQADLTVGDDPVALKTETRYPWDGKVRITVEPGKTGEFAILVRIPGWAAGQAWCTDLYAFADDVRGRPRVTVNGQVVRGRPENGYARLNRRWNSGDVIELDLPMPVRRVVSHPRVQANVGRVALQRGPIVYCAEWPDNDGAVDNILLPDTVQLTAEHRGDLLGGVTVLTGKVPAVHSAGGKDYTVAQPFTAIPYYAWAHRGKGPMAVWLTRRTGDDR